MCSAKATAHPATSMSPRLTSSRLRWAVIIPMPMAAINTPADSAACGAFRWMSALNTGTSGMYRAVMKAVFEAVVSLSPRVWSTYPVNSRTPAITPPRTAGPRFRARPTGPANTIASATAAMVKRVARNSSVLTSASASFTRTNVAPHTMHTNTSATSAPMIDPSFAGGRWVLCP